MSRDDDWFRLEPSKWTDPVTSFTIYSTATSTLGVAHGSGFYLAPEPDDIEISAADWKIIDDFIIDSVVRGHARRM